MDVAILNPLKALKVRYHFGFGVRSLAAQNGSQCAMPLLFSQQIVDIYFLLILLKWKMFLDRFSLCADPPLSSHVLVLRL